MVVNRGIPNLKIEEFAFLRNVGEDNIQEGVNKLLPHLRANLNDEDMAILRKIIGSLKGRMSRNWLVSRRTTDIFMKRFGGWLASPIVVPERFLPTPGNPAPGGHQFPTPLRKTQVFIYDAETKTSTPMTAEVIEMEMEIQTEVTEDPLSLTPQQPQQTPKKRESTSTPSHFMQHLKPKRPRRSYDDLGARAQQKIVTKIYESQSEETVPLLKATIRTLRNRGSLDTASLIAETLEGPDRASKMVKRLKAGTAAEAQNPFTPEEALTLLHKLSLTKEKYNLLRTTCSRKGYKDLFPAYGQVYEAKKGIQDDEGEVGEGGTSATEVLESPSKDIITLT